MSIKSPQEQEKDTATSLPTETWGKLDSLTPLIELLPACKIDDNEYVISGRVTQSDWDALQEFATCVTKYELNVDPPIKENVSQTAYVRLAQLQGSLPLLPSLRHLSIPDASRALSLSQIFFCLTPSLESVSIANIAQSQRHIIGSFLANLAVEAGLHLKKLKLGPGHLSRACLDSLVQFPHLTSLRVDGIVIAWDRDLLGVFSNLPGLTNLVINAMASEYSSQANLMADQPSSQGYVGYPELRDLVIAGDSALIRDLLTYITSLHLESVELTAAFSGLTVPRPTENGVDTSPVASPKPRISTLSKPGKKKKSETRPIAPKPSNTVPMVIEEDPKPLTDNLAVNEDTKDPCDASAEVWIDVFTSAIKMLGSRWGQSLRFLTISTSMKTPASGHSQSPPECPVDLIKSLSVFPNIERLEFRYWKFPSSIDEVILDAAPSWSVIKELYLPVDEYNTGISLSTLRVLAESCPSLISIQTSFDLAAIPGFQFTSHNYALSHGLVTLSAGSAEDTRSAGRVSANDTHEDELKFSVARHLNILFPHLKTIQTHHEYSSTMWYRIDRLVRMFQAVRMDDHNREVGEAKGEIGEA